MPSNVVLALSVAGFVVVAAAAPTSANADVRLEYSQEDLSSLERTKMLYKRIEVRAEQACDTPVFTRTPTRGFEAACARQTTEDLVNGVDDARLNRIHAQAVSGATYAGK